MRRVVLTAFCLVMPLSLLAREGGVAPGRGVNLYSVAREMALGRQLAAELERQVRFVDDPILSEYVNRVAQNLARQSDVTMPISVRLIESGDLNAFTLPGGHIYLNSGMLRLTEAESELAFVLAHELGHVAARHATREATRSQLLQLGALPLSLAGGWTGPAVRQLAKASSNAGLLKGSRDFELEADRLGVDFLDRAGYDPQAAIDVFERIEAKERRTPGKMARLSADHPVTGDRIDKAQKHLAQTSGSRAEYIVNTSEYEQMRLRAVAVEDKRASESSRPVPVRSGEHQIQFEP